MQKKRPIIGAMVNEVRDELEKLITQKRKSIKTRRNREEITYRKYRRNNAKQ